MLEDVDPKILGMIPMLSIVGVQFLKGLRPLKGLLESKEAKVAASVAISVGLAYLMGLANPVVVGVMLGLSGSGGYDLKGLLGGTPK
ncbi:MAG: hypothetical protein ACTSWQ_09815 [Candidatus Thorarchaeota archaeon]